MRQPENGAGPAEPEAGLAVTLWGTRGSLPRSGTGFTEFGGDTMCVELRFGDQVVLVDAGSGIAPAGKALRNAGQTQIDLFFTHSHYDHMMGLPFFAPFYDPAAQVRLWSGHLHGQMTTQDMLCGFMRKPYFPVGPEVFKARIETRDFCPGDVLAGPAGMTVRTGWLNHPDGAVGYRFEIGGRSVAILFDTEHEPGQMDPTVLDLMQGVDLALYDAAFTEDEFETYRNFGHSTWEHAVMLAQQAGVKRLGLVHHALYRPDAELVEIDAKAQDLFPGAFCGRDRQTILL
ncbi:MBL fold metallo-hydrolase [Gemmobacter denitrificans]|uniref:MBL fold metallo-hydrolase n=1 Tax=Gemmobacter denitrificans TaxID=3123040 RepID=A0ABU8BTS9_9RHOB